jgi:ABC-2 type transport system permease protein
VTEAAESGGRVFDLGFRRYEGPREGRRRAFLSVFKDSLRTTLGIGRGARAKVLPWLFIAVLLGIAVIMALIAGAVDRLAPDFNTGKLPSHSDYYSIASIVLLLFAAVVAPELFCPDRRNRVISLYLVRPLRGEDYMAARWLGLVTVSIAAAWVPQLVLLVGLTLSASDPGAYLGEHWPDIPWFLVAGLAVAVYMATLGTLVSSFTTRRAYAAAFLVGLFVVSTTVVGSVSDAVSTKVGRWIALLSIRDVPLLVNNLLFGKQEHLNAPAAAELPGAIQVAWYFLVVGLALLLIWRQARRLSV